MTYFCSIMDMWCADQLKLDLPKAMNHLLYGRSYERYIWETKPPTNTCGPYSTIKNQYMHYLSKLSVLTMP